MERQQSYFATYTTATPFGNAFPPTPGSIEALPLLPDQIGPDSGFEFEVLASDIVPGQTIWIDPIIATGYTYEVTGAEFDTVTLPSFATVPDSTYTVVVDGASTNLTSGDIFDFGDDVTSFQIIGIDETLMLDPTDTFAFVTGVSLDDITASSVTITQTPVTIDTGTGIAPVPLPAGFVLLGSSLIAFGGTASWRRRRSAA